MSDDDAWDAFGSDSDEEGESMDIPRNDAAAMTTPDVDTAQAITTHLVQVFVHHNPQIPLTGRKVLVVGTENAGLIGLGGVMVDCLKFRNIQTYTCNLGNDNATPRKVNNNNSATQDEGEDTDPLKMDAIICLECADPNGFAMINRLLCPGGTLLLDERLDPISPILQDVLYEFDPNLNTIFRGHSVVARQKKLVAVHVENTCPWLPPSHSVKEEEVRLQKATVPLSAEETISSQLSTPSITKAVLALQQYGYCILPQLLDKSECQKWGQAVLDSVHDAAKILKERDHVDIYHPHSSQSEPQSYKELSMREDLRMDIRQGPGLWKIREEKGDVKGNESVVIKATDRDYANEIFLRGQPSILEILRRTMNPHDSQDTLWKGNMGRWNFGGSGADGSFQELRLSPVGGIVSLPGAADQALHADTPHLFENIPDLPAHYINVFAPCTEFDEKVGGTAFVHGSHNLEFTTKYCGDDGVENSKVFPFLVRPKLNVGDVVFFDCRVLHFGLANASMDVERCICYTNTWQNWFHDAKNWDNNRAIFEYER
jgi:hypothetical protein